MSRISFTPAKRTLKQQQADTIFSLRVQVEQALRKAEGSDAPVYRNGLISIMETLDRMHRKTAFETITKRKPNKNLKPLA
jgi:hypothetical protein